MKKIKILELTNFSAGGCGVFARVKREASLLKKEEDEIGVYLEGANEIRRYHEGIIHKAQIPKKEMR